MAPLASRMLADRDADVIKIEPLGGDAMRNGRPGQRGVMLNLFRNTVTPRSVGVRKG